MSGETIHIVASDTIHVLQQIFVNLHCHQNLVVQLDSLLCFFHLVTYGIAISDQQQQHGES
jgi:hypothetical protein